MGFFKCICVSVQIIAYLLLYVCKPDSLGSNSRTTLGRTGRSTYFGDEIIEFHGLFLGYWLQSPLIGMLGFFGLIIEKQLKLVIHY